MLKTGMLGYSLRVGLEQKLEEKEEAKMELQIKCLVCKRKIKPDKQL